MNHKPTITVTKSLHKKCNRCYRRRSDVDYNKYFQDDLCYRCVQVLCELESQGKWKPSQQNEEAA